MDLIALSAFQQIAQHGAIEPASRAGAGPETTLSRRLRQLEEELGIRLAERGPHLFRLTDERAALHDRTHALLAEIEEAGQALTGGLTEPKGRLRVSAPALFTDLHLGSIAAAFAEKYPEVVLDIVSDNRIIDPLGEGFDAVIRVNPATDEEMTGRLLYREEMLLVSAAPPPAPLSGNPASIRSVMLPTNSADDRWTVEHDGGPILFRPIPVLRTTSILAARDAVLRGLGAALLPRSAVAGELAEGRLNYWGRSLDRSVELWILHRSRRLRSAKLAAFVDLTADAFADRR